MRKRVVTASRASYVAGMPASRLVRLLTMFALLLMPLAMAGQGHVMAAAPHGAAAASSAGKHHHHEPAPSHREHEQSSAAQCMMACAALPAPDAPLQDEPAAPQAALFAFPVPALGGLAPEAATPPPRNA